MPSRVRASVAACVVFVFMLTACSGGGSNAGPPHAPTSATSLPSPQTPPFTLRVTVQAGGDCREFDDEWEIRGAGANAKRSVLLTKGTGFQRTESSPPGLIPCQFDFTGQNLPSEAQYFVVNQTIKRGWGPWTLDALQRRGWHVTVAITDLH